MTSIRDQKARGKRTQGKTYGKICHHGNSFGREGAFSATGRLKGGKRDGVGETG